MASIFVSVTSFCDPHLRFTLEGLFSRASAPEQLRVAVIDQSFDGNRNWIKAQPWGNQVQYAQLNPVDSRGCSWARFVAFSFYRGEDFLLQVDSHTDFDAHWDDTLLDQMRYLQSICEKPVLTTYPPPFEFDAAGAPFKPHPPMDTVVWLTVHPDHVFGEHDLTFQMHSTLVDDADFVEGHHIAGGFLFSLGSFVDDVPYDPYMYFQGDEQNMALRAFTRGWTMYHPKESTIPLRHLYQPPYTVYATQHWRDEFELRRVVKYAALDKQAKLRISELVQGKRNGQPFGLGSAASLEDFTNHSGIDYINRVVKTVHPKVITRPKLPNGDQQTLQSIEKIQLDDR